MSFLGEDLATWRLTARLSGQDVPVDLETNMLRQIIRLNLYLDYGDEDLDDIGLGARIDDRLVEFIGFLLLALKKDELPLEVVKETMARIEIGMIEDSALKAYARILMRDGERPLSSATYLNLADRRILYGGKPPPKLEEGRRFVRVFLAPFMTKEYRERDFDIKGITRKLADYWRDHLDPDSVEMLIRHSESSPAAQNLLKLIRNDSVESEATHPLPSVLLQWYLKQWYLEDQQRNFKRPKVASSTRGRRRTYGMRLRDNEIKHAVELLTLVDLPELDARKAVAGVFGFTGKRILKICNDPYWTLKDLHEDVYRRLDPVAYHMSHRPSSDPDPSTPT